MSHIEQYLKIKKEFKKFERIAFFDHKLKDFKIFRAVSLGLFAFLLSLCFVWLAIAPVDLFNYNGDFKLLFEELFNINLGVYHIIMLFICHFIISSFCISLTFTKFEPNPLTDFKVKLISKYIKSFYIKNKKEIPAIIFVAGLFSVMACSFTFLFMITALLFIFYMLIVFNSLMISFLRWIKKRSILNYDAYPKLETELKNKIKIISNDKDSLIYLADLDYEESSEDVQDLIDSVLKEKGTRKIKSELLMQYAENNTNINIHND